MLWMNEWMNDGSSIDSVLIFHGEALELWDGLISQQTCQPRNIANIQNVHSFTTQRSSLSRSFIAWQVDGKRSIFQHDWLSSFFKSGSERKDCKLLGGFLKKKLIRQIKFSWDIDEVRQEVRCKLTLFLYRVSRRSIRTAQHMVQLTAVAQFTGSSARTLGVIIAFYN